MGLNIQLCSGYPLLPYPWLLTALTLFLKMQLAEQLTGSVDKLP